jgi:hypothetical protein
MGMAMEITSGNTTAAGATPIAVTVLSGNSLTVKNANPNSKIWLLNLWTDNQVAGIVRLRSPKMHDNVQGLRFRAIVSEVQPLLPHYFRQPLYAQDVLILELSGSAVAGDIETASFLTFYEDLPGADARFMSPADIYNRMVNLLTVETSHVAGAAGGYTGEVALNSSFDLLKANVDYALLGYQVNTETATLRMRGPDTANLGVGGPGDDTDKHMTRHWFEVLSERYQMPMCPVINAANKGATLCDIAADENTPTVIANWIFAELAPSR